MVESVKVDLDDGVAGSDFDFGFDVVHRNGGVSGVSGTGFFEGGGNRARVDDQLSGCASVELDIDQHEGFVLAVDFFKQAGFGDQQRVGVVVVGVRERRKIRG